MPSLQETITGYLRNSHLLQQVTRLFVQPGGEGGTHQAGSLVRAGRNAASGALAPVAVVTKAADRIGGNFFQGLGKTAERNAGLLGVLGLVAGIAILWKPVTSLFGGGKRKENPQDENAQLRAYLAQLRAERQMMSAQLGSVNPDGYTLPNSGPPGMGRRH